MTAVIWGGTFIAGRMISRDVLPFSAACLRFTIASIFLILVCLKRYGRLPEIKREHFVHLIFLGLSGIFLYNFCFFLGLKHINASRAALIIATNPVFISLFSSVIFKDRLSLFKVLGICLSVFGAIVVISRGDLSTITSTGFGLGELLIFGCVASWVTYSLLGKSVMKTISPLTAVTYSSIIGTCCLFFAALPEGILVTITNLKLANWIGLFYLGFFGTVLGFIWYYQGIQKIGAARASQFINFVPLSAIILAFFILNEPITKSIIAGGSLVVAGVYLTNFRMKNSK